MSFGVGAGAFLDKDGNSNAGGGLGGKMSPSAVLVIQNGQTKLVNVKNQEGLTKILDMVPEVIEKITASFGNGKKSEDLEDILE